MKKIWKCEYCESYQKKNKRIFRRFCTEKCALLSNSIYRWTGIEDDILTKNIHKTKTELLKLLPHRSWISIMDRAHYYLNLTRNSDRCWKSKELNILIDNYTKLPREELLQMLPSRTYDAIKLKASSLSLEKEYPKDKRIASLEILLEDTPLTYYWMGFILADGHINTEIGNLSITLSGKDKDHLQKLLNILEYKKEITTFNRNNYSYCAMSATNIKLIKVLANKFDICDTKTYNPPDLTWIKDKDLLLSLIVGFIDGDGCIRRQYKREDSTIRIKCHSSWLSNLELMTKFLHKLINIEKYPSAKINKRNYAEIWITNHRVINFLKKEAIRLSIPILARKWDVIKDNVSFNSNELKNLSGEKFGIYKVINLSSHGNGSRMWNCLCSCGKIRILCTSYLNSYNHKKCTCSRKNKKEE